MQQVDDNERQECVWDFDVGEQLGKGGFATVYQAQCCKTGRDVAIKKINKSQITAGGLINRVRQEVTIHSRLCHPSILQLYTFFEDQEYVYLVLELCVKGELQKHLKNLGRVKIADFGLATQLQRPDDRHTTMCGTPNYIRWVSWEADTVILFY
ncbi:Serine/threonine-protein kinase PLK4 [Portunus trituberculatus]|uniref:Serine/threonine-protein kinase PLK4 n=1 Tax=Portunus trituberculatus TaxID=210409 RepID=A0A5B7CP17_PORTR|nr:Serine/threonine-protein kinase PLK4 [Portunus trituberculatus]